MPKMLPQRRAFSEQLVDNEQYKQTQEIKMGLGKGALLWMLGIPLPIILLLALFWR